MEAENIPTQFIESSRLHHTLQLNKEDMPWVSQREEIPPLNIAKITTDQGNSVLVASFIAPRFQNLVTSLTDPQREKADDLFYQLVQQVADNQFLKIPQIKNPISPHNTYYGKSEGLRVYAMVITPQDQRLNSLNQENLPLIVRIGIVGKKGNQQTKLLKHLENR